MNAQKIDKLRKTIDNVFFFLHCVTWRAAHSGLQSFNFLKKDIL